VRISNRTLIIVIIASILVIGLAIPAVAATGAADQARSWVGQCLGLGGADGAAGCTSPDGAVNGAGCGGPGGAASGVVAPGDAPGAGGPGAGCGSCGGAGGVNSSI